MDPIDKNIANVVFLVLTITLIGFFTYLDAKHDHAFKCSYCHEWIHDPPDDYIISKDGQYYHPDCYLKLKEEENNG